jgi:hypothetical protein
VPDLITTDLSAAHHALARELFDSPTAGAVISVGRYVMPSGEGCLTVLINSSFDGTPPAVPAEYAGFRVSAAMAAAA